MEATSELFKGFGKDRDEFSSRRAIREWSKLQVPAVSFEDEDMDNPSETFRRADLVFSVVQAMAMEDPKVGDILNKIPDETWRWDAMMARWAEAIYLAVKEHGTDVAKVTREFVLAYTRGLARNAWREMTLEERRGQVELWTEYIEKALTVELPEYELGQESS
jgi:hypothetical protein